MPVACYNSVLKTIKSSQSHTKMYSCRHECLWSRLWSWLAFFSGIFLVDGVISEERMHACWLQDISLLPALFLLLGNAFVCCTLEKVCRCTTVWRIIFFSPVAFAETSKVTWLYMLIYFLICTHLEFRRLWTLRIQFLTWNLIFLKLEKCLLLPRKQKLDKCLAFLYNLCGLDSENKWSSMYKVLCANLKTEV